MSNTGYGANIISITVAVTVNTLLVTARAARCRMRNHLGKHLRRGSAVVSVEIAAAHSVQCVECVALYVCVWNCDCLSRMVVDVDGWMLVGCSPQNT